MERKNILLVKKNILKNVKIMIKIQILAGYTPWFHFDAGHWDGGPTVPMFLAMMIIA